MYWKTIQKCKVLFETFSEPFLTDLCQIMKLKKYNPGEEIFKEKKLTTDLLFLLKGEVQIFANLRKLRTYHEGYVIGLKNFLVSKSMSVTAKSTRFVEIAYIQQEEFLELLKKYPRDFEKFHQLKDSLLFNKRCKHIIDICPVCISTHTLLQCPFTFFQPNINKLVSNKNVENQ